MRLSFGYGVFVLLEAETLLLLGFPPFAPRIFSFSWVQHTTGADGQHLPLALMLLVLAFLLVWTVSSIESHLDHDSIARDLLLILVRSLIPARGRILICCGIVKGLFQLKHLTRNSLDRRMGRGRRIVSCQIRLGTVVVVILLGH